MANQLVELGVVESIYFEIVRWILKNVLKPQLWKRWVIPSRHNDDKVNRSIWVSQNDLFLNEYASKINHVEVHGRSSKSYKSNGAKLFVLITNVDRKYPR